MSISNDNVSRGPDAHGQAALLLVESLIHELVDRSVLTVVNAIEVIDDAVDVSRNLRAELGGEAATIQRSITLLEAISKSLGRDVVSR